MEGCLGTNYCQALSQQLGTNEKMNTRLHSAGCRASWGPGPRWAGTRRCAPAANRTACTPDPSTCCLHTREIKERDGRAIRSSRLLKLPPMDFYATCLHAGDGGHQGRVDVTFVACCGCQLKNAQRRLRGHDTIKQILLLAFICSQLWILFHGILVVANQQCWIVIRAVSLTH